MYGKVLLFGAGVLFAIGIGRPVSLATAATVSVPRPLKLRTGLSVSTFSVTEHPSARPSGAQGSAVVSRNTGSISPTAARTRSSRSRTRSRPLTARSMPRPRRAGAGETPAPTTVGQRTWRIDDVSEAVTRRPFELLRPGHPPPAGGCVGRQSRPPAGHMGA